MNSTYSKNRMNAVFCIFMFRLSLDLIYVVDVSPIFTDHFLVPLNVSFDIVRYVISFFVLFIFSFLIPLEKGNINGAAFAAGNLFMIIPATCMYGLDENLNSHLIILLLLSFFIIYSTVYFKGKKVNLAYVKNGHQLVVYFCIMFSLLFIVWTIVTGIAFKINFDISRVYEFRADFGSELNVGIIAYINVWTAKIFTPFLLALGLYRRSKIIISFSLVMSLYYFGSTQHRSHLFNPILIFMIFIFYQNNLSFAKLYFYSSIVLLIALLLIVIFDLEAVGALVFRRAFFVAPGATYEWISFFSDRSKVYFADNLLSGVVINEFTGQRLPSVLGDYKKEGLGIAYNAGLVATGFAQVGVLGVVLYSFIFGVVIRFINSLIKNGMPVFLTAALLFMPFRTLWSDSDIFTSLLTHGILPGLFILWLYGREAAPAGQKLSWQARS